MQPLMQSMNYWDNNTPKSKLSRVWKLSPEKKLSVFHCAKPEDVRSLLKCKRREKWLFDHLILHHKNNVNTTANVNTNDTDTDTDTDMDTSMDVDVHNNTDTPCIVDDDDYVVYMMFEPKGKHGQLLNIIALRILVDLDLFESPETMYAGEGIHTHCPRGSAIFFKMTAATTDAAHLLDYTWDEFRNDWPLFFRMGDALPYRILERAYTDACTKVMTANEANKLNPFNKTNNIITTTTTTTTTTIGIGTRQRFPMDDYWRICTWDHDTLNRVMTCIAKRPYERAGDRDKVLGCSLAVCVRLLYSKAEWDMTDLMRILKY